MSSGRPRLFEADVYGPDNLFDPWVLITSDPDEIDEFAESCTPYWCGTESEERWTGEGSLEAVTTFWVCYAAPSGWHP